MPYHRPLTLTRTSKPPAQPADHALLALADQLTAAGLDTYSPAWQDRGYLKIINTPGALSELTISACGHLTWEYRPTSPDHDQPALLVTIIHALLGLTGRPSAVTEPRTCLTLTCRVGHALARHGLDVTLDILYVSQDSYDIYSELAITNPARPERGTVSLAPEGTIWWECRTHPAFTLHGITAAIIRALTATP